MLNNLSFQQFPYHVHRWILEERFQVPNQVQLERLRFTVTKPIFFVELSLHVLTGPSINFSVPALWQREKYS